MPAKTVTVPNVSGAADFILWAEEWLHGLRAPRCAA
jgi:hypothetical protein